MAQATGGDRAAFGQLVRQFQDAVAGVVLARLGPGSDVEDVTQDAFVSAWQQLGSLREPARFGPWVCGIARNLALRWLRDHCPAVALPENVAAPPDEESADLADRVMAAVVGLPESLREPVTLYYIDGYTTAEVAGLLELPPGTVRRRLHQARSRLRDHVEKTMGEEIKRNAPPPDLAAAVLDRIAGVRIAEPTSGESQAVVVTDERGQSFPIIIGRREGDALAQALGQLPPEPLPLLYDVMLAMGRQFGIRVSRVRISELKGHTFYALMDIETATGTVTLDARPSDVINLAVRAGADLHVVRGVTTRVADGASRGGWSVFASPETLAPIRKEVRAHPEHLQAKVELARRIIKGILYAAACHPRPLPSEEMVRRSADLLAEVRELLVRAANWPEDEPLRDQALILLGTAEYLEARWAADIFRQVHKPWHEFDWQIAFHCATVMHRTGHDDEALARVADAVKAIDRKFGREPASWDRLLARALLTRCAASNLGPLTRDKRYRELFELVDPPCLVHLIPGPGPRPRDSGPAIILGERPLTIGAAPEADIQVTGDRWAPLHARVFPEQGHWMVEDLGSRAGTFLRGERIEKPTRLHSEWVVHVGPVQDSQLPFLDMAECLAAEPQEDAVPIFVGLGEGHPGTFTVPVTDWFRRGSIRIVAQPVSTASGQDSLNLQPSGEPPDCPGWPVPWAVRRVSIAEEPSTISLTLHGESGD